MRILIGSFLFEGNTFSNALVSQDEFNVNAPVYDNDIFEKYTATETEMAGFIDVLKKYDTDIIPSISNMVFVAGRLEEKVYQDQKNELIKRIKSSPHLDGILLAFHGNMISRSNDNCEGEILEEIRSIVGNEVYIVCTLDKHAIVTQKMARFSDDLVGYDTAPHIDMSMTGRRAAEVIVKLVKNKIKTHIAMQKLPALFHGDKMLTSEEPLAGLCREVESLRDKKGVISSSMFFGCPTLDVAEAGPSIIVTSSVSDKEMAEKESLELAIKYWSKREHFLIKHIPVYEAIERAMEIEGGPVIFTDPADNINAGAYGDTNCILKGLLDKRITDAAIAIIIDPESVKKAIAAGVGYSLPLELGGKLDNINSSPLKVNAYVKKISDGKYIYKGHLYKGIEAVMGRTVLLAVNGIEVIITESRPANVSDPQLFRSIGIEPVDKKIIVLKDGLHFRANYGQFAKEIFYIDCPGSSDVNFEHIKYYKVKRPVFPLDNNAVFP